MEIPQLECRRAGIRDWKVAWITVSEFNHDIAEQSFYYDPDVEVLGSFSNGSETEACASIGSAHLRARLSKERLEGGRDPGKEPFEAF